MIFRSLLSFLVVLVCSGNGVVSEEVVPVPAANNQPPIPVPVQAEVPPGSHPPVPHAVPLHHKPHGRHPAARREQPIAVRSAPVVHDPPVPAAGTHTSSVEEQSVVTTTFAPIDFEKAKSDIVKNIKRQYNILRNLTDEFKDVFARESAQAQGIYKNLTKSLSWYFSEPDEQETRELDAVLSEFYPFGSKESDYVDSLERMENFCSLREKRLDMFKSWIRRKYRYNMVIQVALNMLVARIDSKTEYYCNATAHREDYVKHMKTAKAINNLLVEPKNAMIDAAIFIQNSEYQLPKVGRICCAFWAFFRQLLLNIKSSQSVDFVVEMTRHYFSSSTRYVCFLYPYGSELCKDEEPSPKVPHKYESIILEGSLTLGEIAAP